MRKRNLRPSREPRARIQVQKHMHSQDQASSKSRAANKESAWRMTLKVSTRTTSIQSRQTRTRNPQWQKCHPGSNDVAIKGSRLVVHAQELRDLDSCRHTAWWSDIEGSAVLLCDVPRPRQSGPTGSVLVGVRLGECLFIKNWWTLARTTFAIRP